MRSRRVYTSEQAAEVRRLLRHRVGAPRREQKLDRDALRTAHGFWISDFWPGFTDRDFEAKVDDGTFSIVG